MKSARFGRQNFYVDSRQIRETSNAAFCGWTFLYEKKRKKISLEITAHMRLNLSSTTYRVINRVIVDNFLVIFTIVQKTSI